MQSVFQIMHEPCQIMSVLHEIIWKSTSSWLLMDSGCNTQICQTVMIALSLVSNFCRGFYVLSNKSLWFQTMNNFHFSSDPCFVCGSINLLHNIWSCVIHERVFSFKVAVSYFYHALLHGFWLVTERSSGFFVMIYHLGSNGAVCKLSGVFLMQFGWDLCHIVTNFSFLLSGYVF